eukprot:3268210-Ditylum_brightwellii.AAC.1
MSESKPIYSHLQADTQASSQLRSTSKASIDLPRMHFNTVALVNQQFICHTTTDFLSTATSSTLAVYVSITGSPDVSQTCSTWFYSLTVHHCQRLTTKPLD